MVQPNPPAFNPQHGSEGVDTDTYIPPTLGVPEIANTTLTAAEVNRRNNNSTVGTASSDGNNISSFVSQNDFSSFGSQNDNNTTPEPSSTSQDIGPTSGVDAFSSFGSKVAAPANANNTMTAGGAPVHAGARNDSSGGLSPQFNTISIDPQPNQLSDYASHTYNIALYMMQPKEYVKLLKAPTSVGQIPKRLLMRSGGVGNDGGKNFDVDFYIDNLQMTNLGISPNTRTTNTNAVDISFEITEPMGVTLIERLKEEAKNSLEEAENYTKTPYLLEITFKGYDDTGREIVGAIKPKYIPIKLTELTFRVESTGTVYKVKAIPYHQDVFNSMTSTIPINIQVSAGTVNDIFGGSAQQFNHEEETVLKGVEDELGRVHEELIATGNTKTILGETSTSLNDAVNRFYEAQTKPTTDKDSAGNHPAGFAKKIPSSAEIAEKWSFEIAPEIKNAKLVGSKFDALNTPQKSNKVYQQASSGIRGKVTLDSKTNLFKINAGTNVVSLMNYIVVASEFVDKNIENVNKVGTSDAPENKEISWFKIIPQIIDYIGWDKKQGRYKFHIKWTISVHGMYYSDFPWATKSMPKGTGVHKTYDYIFSGLNTEITDLTLQFDSAYYTAHTIGTGIKDGDKDKSNLAPMSKSIPQSKQGQGIINDTTVTKKRSKDLMSSLMYDGYDMISLDLAILGDPAFLPIGDAFFQPQGNRKAVYNNAFLPDDTINYDLTPPYIQLNLKTPADYDEHTGLVDLYSKAKYTSSEYSGVYRVVSSESSFSGGMFSQRLNCIREKMQPIEGKIGRSKESIKNAEDKAKLTDDLTAAMIVSIFGGVDPIGSLISQGTSVLTTYGESVVTGLQANRIQNLADETDQGRFEEGIGDEEPPVELIDNNSIISEDQYASTFQE